MEDFGWCWFWFGFGVFWMMPSSSLGRGGGMEERGVKREGGREGGEICTQVIPYQFHAHVGFLFF